MVAILCCTSPLGINNTGHLFVHKIPKRRPLTLLASIIHCTLWDSFFWFLSPATYDRKLLCKSIVPYGYWFKFLVYSKNIFMLNHFSMDHVKCFKRASLDMHFLLFPWMIQRTSHTFIYHGFSIQLSPWILSSSEQLI